MIGRVTANLSLMFPLFLFIMFQIYLSPSGSICLLSSAFFFSTQTSPSKFSEFRALYKELGYSNELSDEFLDWFIGFF